MPFLLNKPWPGPALALAAIALWATLAPLGVSLSHVPPFLLTGLSLLIGSLWAWPLSRGSWRVLRVPARTLLLGVYGLFGFHFLLFLALRTAPPVQANLINYLWPLGMVILAPLFLPTARLRPAHGWAALMGFAGAALAISGGQRLQLEWHGGYLWALGSAFIWASYSLMTQRVAPFSTAAIGVFAAVSGALALVCHGLLEPTPALTPQDLLRIALLGLGPLGAAFYLWDAALKRGQAQRIGLLSFLTPLLSTGLLVVQRGQWPETTWLLAALLIVAAAWIGRRA